jgi:hypothetical protein
MQKSPYFWAFSQTCGDSHKRDVKIRVFLSLEMSCKWMVVSQEMNTAGLSDEQSTTYAGGGVDS